VPTPALSVAEFLKLLFPGLVVVTAAYVYGVVFWGLQAGNTLFVTLYAFWSVFLGLMIDAWDPLLNWKRLPETTFFRDQFPSKYLESLCRKCVSPCCRTHTRGSQLGYRFPSSVWFYIFDNLFTDYLRGYVLSVSSACRAVLYTKYTALAFAAPGTMTWAVQWKVGNTTPGSTQFVRQAAFTLVCCVIFLLVNRLHRTDNPPSGVWGKWARVCQDQVFWLRANLGTVKSLLCQARDARRPPARGPETVDENGRLRSGEGQGPPTGTVR